MDSIGFEKISSNCDIMIPIYKMLKFIDQLRLSRVNSSCQEIFENFVWTKNYSIMDISKKTEIIKITNASRDHILRLQRDEFQEFLQVYADKLEKLTELCEHPIDVRNFRNLTNLLYHEIVLPEEHLQMVTENCQYLKQLGLHYCRYDKEREPIVLGRNFSIDYLLSLEKLKYFEIEFLEPITLQHADFQDILHKLSHLEYLQIKSGSISDTDSVTDIQQDAPLILQQLQIINKFNPKRWFKNYPNYTSSFEMLVSLEAKIPGLVNDEILQKIARTWISLTTFKIVWTNFKDITYFALPPEIKELHVKSCKGLTFENLKELLTQHQSIQKLWSSDNRYEGSFEEFPISSAIQSLYVEEIDPFQFRLAYEDNMNLKELSLSIGDEYIRNIPLASCLNLEVLDIDGCTNYLPALLQLPSLRELTVELYDQPFSWSDIVEILKHPNLKEIAFGDSFEESNGRNRPVQGFQINIVFLKIPLSLFENAMDFFLNLFCCNPHLKMIIYRYAMPPWVSYSNDFIRTMTFHQNFPQHLKFIELNCYKIGR